MNLDTFKAMSTAELPDIVVLRLPRVVAMRFNRRSFDLARKEVREMIVSRGFELREFFDERENEHIFIATRRHEPQARPADVRPMGEAGAARRALPGPAASVAHEPIWQSPGGAGPVGDPDQ